MSIFLGQLLVLLYNLNSNKTLQVMYGCVVYFHRSYVLTVASQFREISQEKGECLG